MIAFYIILSLVLGLIVGYLFARQQGFSTQQRLQQSLTEKFEEDKRMMTTAHEDSVNTLMQQKAEAEKAGAVAQSLLDQAQRHEQQMREEAERQAAVQKQLIQEELKTMTAQLLKDARDELNTADRQRLDGILTPLKEKIDSFTKTVSDNSRDSATHKVEIKTAFETLVHQFSEEQQRAVSALKEQTERIGADAANLTKALKGDSKMQGDWGEMILEQTLTDYGLVKDEQYVLQPTYKDKQGNSLRPDAVICFPNGDKVIVDSKVSLTAYAEAMSTDDEEARQQLMKEHVASMKRHVDELAEKHYDKVVEGSIGYVLMFIPYESGYAAAIKADATIMNYAYKKHIILLSPANLLVTLQLTNHMWQNYNLNKNAEMILNEANGLYDKFVNFGESFLQMGVHLDKSKDAYNEALGQLKDGRGNVVRRLEKMKQLGIQPKKSIPKEFTDEE